MHLWGNVIDVIKRHALEILVCFSDCTGKGFACFWAFMQQ